MDAYCVSQTTRVSHVRSIRCEQREASLRWIADNTILAAYSRTVASGWQVALVYCIRQGAEACEDSDYGDDHACEHV